MDARIGYLTRRKPVAILQESKPVAILQESGASLIVHSPDSVTFPMSQLAR